MDEEMQHGDVLRHASTVLARNLRERHFVGMNPNPVMPPRVHFNHPLPEMASEPLEPVPAAEEQALPAPSAADSQAAPDTQANVQSLPVAEDATAVALCFGTDSSVVNANPESQQNPASNEVNDAEPEPRSASNQTYVSESVARKKKRVTDATCLRDMVNIQKQYLARDKKMGDKVTATLNSASRLMQSISSLVDEEKKYLEKKEKRE